MRSAIVVVLALSTVRVALADNTSRSDALFEQGRELEKAGHLAEACEKYHAALELDPNAVGTMLNVALCYERAGKVASAYKLFKDARDRAHEQNLGPHAQAAEEHMQTLEGQVPHLALAFAEAPTDDTKIVVGDEVIPRDAASDVLVDPGVVTVVVSRPGRVTYETRVTIAKAQREAIVIPRLALPVTMTVRSGRKTFGKWLMISGAGMVAIGIGIGLDAKYRLYDHWVPSHCPTVDGVPTCDAQGTQRTSTALDMGYAATAVSVAGLVVAGIGGYLWYFGPRDSHVAFAPRLDGQQAGIVAFGQF